jgi:zinc protease
MRKYLALLAAALPLFAQLPEFGVPVSRAKPPAAAQAKPPAAGPAKPAPAPVRTPSAIAPKDLKFPALRPVSAPPVQVFQLANGMKIFLMEDRELPVVAGTAMVKTGGRFDPPEQIGLAALAGIVMRTGGTKTRTVEQLDTLLEARAATVDCTIGDQSAILNFFSLKERATEVLEAFRDVMTSPEFRQEKVDLAKAQVRNAIARRNDDLRALAQGEFSQTIYGKDTTYGRRVEYATISRIGRAQLQAFHKRYFFPANVRLAVRGDFAAAEMKTLLEKTFAGWTETQPPVPDFPKVTAGPAPGIYLAEKKDAHQAFFAIGHLASELRDKDYPALVLAASILGTGGQSRLAQRMRTRPVVNEISALWAGEYDAPGLFRISGVLRSGDTDAIKEVLDEFEHMRSAAIQEEELKAAKDAALNSLVFAFDTKAKVLNRLLTYDYYGYPNDFLEQSQKAIAAVTKADVERVLRERIDPARFTIVAVGGRSDFPGIDRLGRPVIPIDLTIPDPKVEVTRQDENSLEKGKQMLARAQAAAGGVDKLLEVKDTTLIADFKLSPAAGGMQVTETDRWLAPSYFRQESQIPKQGRIVAFFDGKSGTISTPTGSGILSGSQLRQVRGDLFRLYIPLLLSDRTAGKTVNAIDDSTIEISDVDGNVARLVLDAESGLPSQVLYDTVPSVGLAISADETFSDFREIAGIRFPFAYTIRQSGQKFADVTVTDFQVNKGLKLEDLRRRQ